MLHIHKGVMPLRVGHRVRTRERRGGVVSARRHGVGGGWCDGAQCISGWSQPSYVRCHTVFEWVIHEIFTTPPTSSHGRGVGAYLFVACLNRLTIDHAFLSRRSTVPTPKRDTSNSEVLITFLLYTTQEPSTYLIPILFCCLWPPSIS